MAYVHHCHGMGLASGGPLNPLPPVKTVQKKNEV
jgi:hypothetical protein